MKIAAASLALLALARPATETLEFGPAQRLVLEKRFEIHLGLEKRSMTMSIDGREMPAAMTKETEMEMDSRKTIVVRDEYVRMDGARPLQLVRTYDTLMEIEREKTRMPGMPAAQEQKKETAGKLAGTSVLFRWNHAKDRYDTTWVGESAEDDFLKGLVEDMDLRRLLPAKPVSEGAVWKVDMKGFGGIIGPGGDLGFQDEAGKGTEFEDNVTGESVCTYAGVVTVERRKLARVRVVCKLRSFMEKQVGERRIRMDVAMKLDGELRWDVEAKYLESYGLAGDVAARMKVMDKMQIEGDALDVLVDADLGGECEVTGKFTKP